MASAIVGALRVILGADTAEFDTAMKRTSASAKAWSTDLGSIGKQATALGSSLTKTLTLPIVGLGLAAVKAATDFESSFAGVRKTVDATEPEFAALAQGLRDMAKEIPVSVNELNKVAESAGQLGIKKDDILQFTRTMADLGVATNLTADEAATATAQMQNIFGAAGKDVDRFGSTLAALGNAGASTEKDIIAMGLRIAGAGHQVGLTQAQVLSFASALSSVGINAEAGGSAISRTFLKIGNAVSKGGEDLAEFARIAGMSGPAFKQAFETDAAGATVAFINGLSRLKKEGENVNIVLEGVVGKNIILKDTLMRAAGAGQMLNEQLALGTKAWQDNTALTAEATKRYATFESQLKVLWNQIQDVAITLGTSLLPVMKDLISLATPMVGVLDRSVKAFVALPEPIRLTAIAIAGLVASLGPILWTFGQLALASVSVSKAFEANGIATRALNSVVSGLSSVMTPVLAVVRGLGAGIAALSLPLTGVIVAIGALSVAWAKMTGDWTRAFDVLFPPLGILRAGWDKLREAMAPHVQLMEDITSIVRDSLTVAWFMLKSALQDMASAVLDPIAAGWNNLVSAGKAVTDWIEDKALGAFSRLKAMVADLPGFQTLLAVLERMKAFGEDSKTAIHNLATGFHEVAVAVGETSGPAVAAHKSLLDFHDGIKPVTTGLEMMNRQAEQSGPAFANMMANASGFSAELARVKAVVAGLTKEQRNQIESGVALGHSVTEIAKALSISDEAVKMYTESLKKGTKATEDKAKATREYYNWLGERQMEAAANEMAAAESQKKTWRDYYNWLGERRMEAEAAQLEWQKNAVNPEWLSKMFVPLKAAIKQHLPDSETWTQAWDGLKSGLGIALAGVPATLAKAFEGGGDIWGAAKSIGTQFGSILGGWIGFGIGGMSETGKAIGAALGGLVGPLMEGFKKLFGIGINEAVKKANVEIEKLRGQLIQTHGTLDELEVAANRVGLSFKENWGHQGQGGLKAMNDLMAEFERRTKAVADASAAAISGFAAVVAAMTKPLMDAGQALEGGALDKAKQQLADLGTQAMATFAAAMAAGKSYGEAIAAVGPSLNTLAQAYKSLGVDVEDVALKHLLLQSTVAEGNPVLMTAVAGLNSSMQALAQLGLLNVETFGAMQRTGEEMYARLQGAVAAAGGTTRDALLPMQSYLQEAAAQAALLGIPLDNNTQLLIDQSKELGIWKDKGKSSMDLLIEGLGEMVALLKDALGQTLGITGAINGLPARRHVQIDIDESVTRTITEFTRQGGEVGEGFASGTLGRMGKWFGSFPKAGFATALHGVEAVITPDQAPQFAMDVLSGMGGGMSTASGPDMSGMDRRLENLERLFGGFHNAVAVAVSDAVLLKKRSK